MSHRIMMTDPRRGAWLVNIGKHLLFSSSTEPGLNHLENIDFAGKSGSLLIKLTGDEAEKIPIARAQAHGRACGINKHELRAVLDILKYKDCVDFDQQRTQIEVLPFGRQRVLEVTWEVFQNSNPTPLEEAILEVLEFTLLRPRLEEEIAAFLKIDDDQLHLLLGLVRQFDFLGNIKLQDSGSMLYFNEYQFAERADGLTAIGKALASLGPRLHEELNDLLTEVRQRPGLRTKDAPGSEEAKRAAIGLGFLDENVVRSPAGEERFLTLPRLSTPSVGRTQGTVEDDVFHHAKMLLSSLRFGEVRSAPSRGRIIDPAVLVKTLIDRDRVGPCTAIGQDYIILEQEGVIRTYRADYKPGQQFYMELRRREPADMVLALLESGDTTTSPRSLQRSLELPMGYSGPEVSRSQALRQTKLQDPAVMESLLEILRS